MVQGDAAERAAAAPQGSMLGRWRWAPIGALLALPVMGAEALMHGGLVVTPSLVAISLVLGLVTAWVLEQELGIVGQLRTARIIRRPTRDRVTLGGMALWLAGTVVAASSGMDDPARGLASAVALGGLSGWVAGPLRTAIRRRLAGEPGPLASLPSVLVLIAATVGGVACLIVAIVIWATA